MDATTAPEPARSLEEVWRTERPRLVHLAGRMLGDPAEAEDVVQEAFDRLARATIDDLSDVGGWLAVVVRRRCLDRIKSARSRREVVDGAPADRAERPGAVFGDGAADPADRATLDEQVQLALAVVLDYLSPAERTSFVLHDVFGFSFAAVSEIVGRTPAACRQLASRARRTIREDGAAPVASPRPRSTSALVAERFVAACAGGDIVALLAVLDPDVDGVATLLGHGPLLEVRGRGEVAERLLGLFGPASQMVMVAVPVGDDASIVAFRGGTVAAVIQIEVEDDLVHHISSYVRLGSGV